jgi:hypothetical protein
MACSSLTLCEELATRACVCLGGTRRLKARFWMGSDQPRPSYLPFKALGRGSPSEVVAAKVGTFAFTQALRAQGRLINPKGGKR